MICASSGWGTGSSGTLNWGGGIDAIPGGSLPTTTTFDIYCVGPCGPMSVFTTYSDVDMLIGAGGDGTQFAVDPVEEDTELFSGGAYPAATAALLVNTSVPASYTLDTTLYFAELPTSFASLATSHCLLLVTSNAGTCAGLLFSRTGVAYVGGAHYDGGLVLDSVLQPLPDSDQFILEKRYWTIRIAADDAAVYIYMTPADQVAVIGHQLRYIMPPIPASALAVSPADKTLISVCGTAGNPTSLYLDSICLGTGLHIPNLPPRANTGADQGSRTCNVVQLHGDRSYDPEGAPLKYQWRLIDAPIGSQFLLDGIDGATYPAPIPTGYTDKFYSASLEEALDGDEVEGEILLLSGTPYTLMGSGTDGHGFYVRVDGHILSDSLSKTRFKFLRQFGINNPTTVSPTFLPDVVGIFKFDLTVFDGQLYSTPDSCIVDVVETHVPRGLTPDVQFIWEYLSDFWRLIDDKDRITTTWTAMAQVAASELLTLWQHDYAKSLRDIQRTFQRRWLHYDFRVDEPLPSLTTVRHRATTTITGAGVGIRSYQADQDLSGADVKKGDFLVLDSVAYEIVGFTTVPAGTGVKYRLLLGEDLPAVPATTGTICGYVHSEGLNFYNGLFAAGDTVELLVDGVPTQVGCLGVSSSRQQDLPIPVDTLGPPASAITLARLWRNKYIPIAQEVVGIPLLQEKIKDSPEDEILRANVDFFLTKERGFKVISFNTDVWEGKTPPDRVWAETTYIDNNPTIERNFGAAAGLTLTELAQLPETVDYLSAVRGLWYSYMTGPTLFNLRAGTQILLGLPFIEEPGTITEIRKDFSARNGRVLVEDETGVVRSYTFPAALNIEVNPATGVAYVVGDRIERFAPLVTGVEVVDYVKSPEWFLDYHHQGMMFEVEKFFKFLMRVDSSIFNLPALLFAQSFVRKIKPTYTHPLFVVQAKQSDAEVSTTAVSSLLGTLEVWDGALTQLSEGTAGREATMTDKPNTDGGGWVSTNDSQSDGSPNLWAADRNLLSPEDGVYAKAIMTSAVDFTPGLDSVFGLDTEVWESDAGLFEDANVLFLPTEGLTLYGTNTSTGVIVDRLQVAIKGFIESTRFDLELLVDGNVEAAIQVIPTPGTAYRASQTVAPVTINPGSVVSMRIVPAAAVQVLWQNVIAQAGVSVGWFYPDAPAQVPAGTYWAYRLM